MTSASAASACLNCGRHDSDRPQLQIRYKGVEAWLCVQCLPLLIHHPEQVSEKLEAFSAGGGRG